MTLKLKKPNWQTSGDENWRVWVEVDEGGRYTRWIVHGVKRRSMNCARPFTHISSSSWLRMKAEWYSSVRRKRTVFESEESYAPLLEGVPEKSAWSMVRSSDKRMIAKRTNITGHLCMYAPVRTLTYVGDLLTIGWEGDCLIIGILRAVNYDKIW